MRLLLVDDERLILEELITITDWKRIGIDHIETAGNVEQAKGIIQSRRPDIILCDIEMPQSSGLELLEWCRDNAPETETVILTCHAQFSYAQTAVRLGSLDYLLKPVTEDTLIRVIRSAQEKIQRRLWKEEFSKYGEIWMRQQEYWREKFWEDLFLGKLGEMPEEWKKEAEKRNILDELEPDMVPVLYRIYGGQEAGEKDGSERRALRDWLEREGRRGREILLAPKTGVLLTEAREAEGGELREYLLHAPWEREYTAYIGKACSWDQLRGEVERLLDLMLDNVSCIRGIELAERMEKRRPIPPLSMEGWDSLIESGKERGILHSCMEWLQEGKRNGSLTRACLQLFQHDIEQVLYAALQDCGIQAHQFLYKGNMLNERLEAVHTVSEMENWLRKVLSGTAALLKEAGEPKSVTERVKQYVRTSVGKDISRKEVADKMYLNPDYLDRIFKKETGMSVNRFITAEKVSMAKKLLNKGELSVSEVASRCGYTNLSGFSAMFKKETGENPTEYKKHD